MWDIAKYTIKHLLIGLVVGFFYLVLTDVQFSQFVKKTRQEYLIDQRLLKYAAN